MADEESAKIEMVLVPRHPTKEMLDAAYWAIHSEDGVAVWEKMTEAWLEVQQRKL